MAKTKKEAIEILKGKGIEFDEDASAAILSAMAEEALAGEGAGSGGEEEVSFSSKQMDIVNKMIQDAIKGTANPNDPISVYDMRDPKKIETVNVRRYDAKFVMGFENFQKDPMKAKPRYITLDVDPIRKLPNEPYLTLLLSADGKTIEKRKVMLVDYMAQRDVYVAKVLEVKEKEIIRDHGILGNRGSMGIAVDEKYNPEPRLTMKAQTKSVERSFVVQLPEFSGTTEFISDFLA